MAGKLVRNTSTEELKKWWDAVESLAQQAPRLILGPRESAPRHAARPSTGREPEGRTNSGDRREVD